MKPIEMFDVVKVEEGVQVVVSGLHVSVTGPLGVLQRDFKNLPVEISAAGDEVRVTVWFGTKKQLSCIQTTCSHIRNMMKGVKHGYEYKMKSVYMHFPINISVLADGTCAEIRNFLGGKNVLSVHLRPGAVVRKTGEKDELAVTGICLESVSQSAALIQQAVVPRGKDKRKFLDGIYVSESGLRSH
ncbi:MAG: 60S ribosomal protein L9 [Amphiamblys sp. WSBS2006]|nr:MAG: 60S ribosomal protein L9 [Amphiamblys sp. WSBS2006]